MMSFNGVALWLILLMSASAVCHIIRVHMTPQTPVTPPNEKLKCIGWRQTSNCDPNGKREPKNDTACDTKISANYSGYCEVHDIESGEIKKMMLSSCGSVLTSYFTCNMVQRFSNFKVMAKIYEQKPVPVNLQPSFVRKKPTRGILISASDKTMPNAYVNVRVLRDGGCTLPIEIWHGKGEISDSDPRRIDLATNYNVTFRTAHDNAFVGWFIKPYAIFYSSFDEVLLLDADNLAVRDPSYLFDTKEFQETGAIFWPDFWRPGRTIFDFDSRSMAWELFGVEYKFMFEQESGQILINRRKSFGPLNRLMFYASHFDVIKELDLVYGDKDLFRFAWMSYGQEFHMIKRFPGSAGPVVDNSKFCGMVMVQHDPAGEIIFLHRNSIKFSFYHGNRIWMNYIQQFTGTEAEDYLLSMEDADDYGFDPALSSCFGYVNFTSPDNIINGTVNFLTRPIESFDFGMIEHKGLKFLEECHNLVKQYWVAKMFALTT